MTAEEGQKVVDYCEAKGVKIAAGLMMRFGSYIQEMKKAIAEGKIGKPVSGYAQFTCWYPDIPGACRQTKADSGGGAMMSVMGEMSEEMMGFMKMMRLSDALKMAGDAVSLKMKLQINQALNQIKK